MENIFRKIVGHKKTIIVTFLIAVIICFISGNFVSVNYDMNDYLPEDIKNPTYEAKITNSSRKIVTEANKENKN